MADQPAPDPAAEAPAPASPPAAPEAPAGPSPDPASPPPPATSAGLFEQLRCTIAAGRRLVTTHVDLARAELAEIVERAKAAAILVAVAVALVLFVAILIPIGITLFLGEWLFGSIGWGVLLGTLGCFALVVILLLAALDVPRSRLGTSLIGALAIGLVIAIVLGLAWPNQAFARVGESVLTGVDAGVRPLVIGLGLGALVVGILGLLVGARAAGAGGAVGGLVAGAILGLPIGAFVAISFSLHVGIALGVCAAFISWPALAATALRNYDWAAFKARFWPGVTIETTKETIEWVRARTPLGRKP